MKKVLYVFSSSNFSGAEIVIKRLIASNERVIPIVVCPQGTFSELLKSENIKVVEENSLSSFNRKESKISRFNLILKVALKFIKINFIVAKLITREKIHIVHSNNLTASFYILPLVLIYKFFRSKIRFIWSNHDLVYPDKSSNKYASICVSKYHLTLAVSNSVKLKFSDYQNKIAVLYNGLDRSIFQFDEEKRQIFRDNINVYPTDIVIGIFGLIISRKGHHLLIDAFNAIQKYNPQVKLVIAGKFIPNEKDYENYIRDRVSKNASIILLDYIKDVITFYSGIDILINASTPDMSEPLGTTIYEAMACKRIVIASATGGSPEIINDKNNGFLFKAGDVGDLTKTLSIIISNLNSYTHIIEAAEETVKNKFDIKTMVEKYNLILENIKA